MAYLEFEIPAKSWSSSEKEILYAHMSQIGFDGFVEGEEDIQAYIEEQRFSSEELNLLIDELATFNIKVQYRYHITEDQNWNKEWEKKFSPVVVDEGVLIRAPFHDASGDLEYTLVIEPKMSFGTGHHHTTRLMIKEMSRLDLTGMRILDMGCGTGVLGIYGCLKGAKRVLGVDFDQWAYENALENAERNQSTCMEVRLGDVGVLGREMFDIILANITRNTLVRDMSEYASHLVDEGRILVSGILAEDAQYVLNAAYQSGLHHENTEEESNWISLSFIKQNKRV
jgi:ribosomal protein L11 methyltransferase